MTDDENKVAMRKLYLTCHMRLLVKTVRASQYLKCPLCLVSEDRNGMFIAYIGSKHILFYVPKDFT